MAGTVTIDGSATGLGSGSKVIGPYTITGSATIGQVTDVTLASGDNSVAVPAGATAAIIFPPAANTVALKVRVTVGDVGMFISKTNPTLISFDSANLPAALLINAASLTSGITEITFI